MSTLETPACMALLAVMVNLALCLGALGRLSHPVADRPDAAAPAGIVTPLFCGEVERRAPLAGTPGAPSC